MAFTGPVGAKGPPCDNTPCEKPPDEPVGTTCSEFYSNDPKVLLGNYNSDPIKLLSFQLTKDKSEACFDVTSGAGHWSMEVQGEAAPRVMYVMIRDANPGDFCGDDGYQVRNHEAVLGAWDFLNVPSSYVNACGEERPDGDDPLTFYVSARNVPRTGLTITVTIP
jgi:hypothetical protein